MKLKPGQTFEVKIQGEKFCVNVLSVADKIEAEEALQAAIDAGGGFTKAWLKIAEKHARCVTVEKPLGEVLSSSMLDELVDAIVGGNEPTGDELKN